MYMMSAWTLSTLSMHCQSFPFPNSVALAEIAWGLTYVRNSMYMDTYQTECDFFSFYREANLLNIDKF